MFVPEEFQKNWWELDIAKLEEMGKAETNKDVLSRYVPSGSVNDKIKQEIKLTMHKYQLFEVVERLRDEKINNVKCYHYKIKLNKENFSKTVE